MNLEGSTRLSGPPALGADASNDHSPFESSRREGDAAALAESLRRSEQRYRSLIEATAAIVWNTPASGQFQTPQPDWSAFTGQSFEQLKGSGWIEAVHPEDRRQTQRAWAQSLKSHSLYKVEHRLRRQDGQYRYMLVRAVPVWDENGKLIEWVGIHTDITDRRRGEQESQFLAEASEILAKPLDYQASLMAVAKLAAGRIADWCAFDLTAPNSSARQVMAWHADAGKRELAAQMQERYPPRIDSRDGVAEALRSAKVLFWEQIAEEQLRSWARDEEHAKQLLALGLRSGIIVPLQARGRVLGALSLFTAESGRAFDAQDLSLAQDLARRAAMALDSAMLYREAREAVRAREEVTALLDTLLEKAPVGFAFFNNELRLLRINEELSRIDGLPPQEHWGRRISEVLPDMPAALEQHLNSVKMSGQPLQNIEVSGNSARPGGPQRDLLVSLYPVRAEGAKLLGIGAMIVDITERKAAERALRESERRFRELTNAVPLIVWMARPDGVLDYYNDRWYQFSGLAREAPDPRGFEPMLHPNDVPEARRKWQDAIRTGTMYDIEYRFKDRQTGGYRWFLGRAVPLRDDAGSIIRWVGTCADIHDKKMAQEILERANVELEQRVQERTGQLRESNQQLERSNRELQDFASVASHDLQEPLRKIQAFGDRLAIKLGADLTPDKRDYLDRMLRAAGRMQTLINDLLAFARVTTKAQPFGPVDLRQVASDVVGDLETTIEQSGGTVEVGPLPTIDADPTQMRQLLQNLIVNALKFRKPDVVPIVRLGGEITADGRQCILSVADNGIGFDEKYLDRIFNVFQRLHGRGAYEGTGIGLAVCRKIAERHGGSITARSNLGAGSTFIVTLCAHHGKTEESRG